MKKIVQVRISKGDEQFVAECLDLPVVTQGKTLDELTENIREAITLHLRGENLADLELAEDPSIRIFTATTSEGPARQNCGACRGL